ncbi:protein NO VEIN-like isoform X1 [Phoenix dactylifera]|uniref:Protein NO VEIN-like isoform X1 n=2 Tax=Phoenix dactylifera TaxID=42345 RepID=A0A8B8ZI56_PHODC|nr:protein NO VEIN-like isoform X1 [Phoenix dactylifera]
MYRPPQRYVRTHGGAGVGGGGGGFPPPNYTSQNPNFPFSFPGNLPYPPGVLQFPIQNPNFSQHRNPYLQNPTFSLSDPSPSPPAILERVEAAVVKAHRDLVTAGESVSAWKVSQSALISLKADSWSSLGFQLQDVPSLHRLIVTEGKVNAFIHCFVGARRITSLYDLEVAICKSEGVERFEELGLGPLSRHPLAEHYFSIPSDVMEVFKITSEEIISLLQKFIDKCKKTITAEEFLKFLAEQNSVPVKEKLGVRVQSLGLHISYIREARKAEKAIIHDKSLELIKHNVDKIRERDLSQPPGMLFEKQVLDKRFDLISKRIKSFSSTWVDFAGKHVRFDSSDEDKNDSDDDGQDDLRKCQHQNSTHNKDSGKRVSSCPYPSTTEEMVRLGLKFEAGDRVSPGNGKLMENGGKKSSGKKRKFEGKTGDGSSSWKLSKKEQSINLEDQKYSHDLTVTSDNMEKFITTWKEACREHSVEKVLDMMVNFYAATIKQKKRIRKIFLSYPGIGLLNVAVTSIKCGMLDSFYDAFQAIAECGFTAPDSAPSVEIIETGPLIKENTVSSNKGGAGELGYSVTVDDIIKKVGDYFKFDELMPRVEDLPSERKLSLLKKFHDCDIWLTNQFSVKEFSSLGYGDFFEFLEKYASALPNELHSFLSGGFYHPPCLEVSMLQQQLGVLLCQTESNWIDNGVITKHDVSMLLKKQFPPISFRIVGSEPEKCFVDLIKRQKESDNSNCILFSTTLLGKRWTGNLLQCSEKSSLEYAGLINEAGQNSFPFGTVSSKDAIECLLKAPMLSDLRSWSQWDLVYSPSLGPLVEWLLNEVHNNELLCIVTVDGKIIRVDPSATVDEYLEALIQCSSLQAAVKLLSLLSLYGGTCKAPVSLLKCYTQRAIDVIIKNSSDVTEENTTAGSLMPKSPLHGLAPFDKVSNGDLLSGNPQGTSEAIYRGTTLCKSLSRTNKTITFVASFMVECLGHLPSEFWSFAADVLVSGLQCFAKNAPLVILDGCNKTDQRLMLHDIGLSLGITEWIEDYHAFHSAAASGSRIVRETSCTLSSASGMEWKQAPDISEKPATDTHEMLVSAVTDAALSNESNETYGQVRGKKNAHVAGGHHKEFGHTCKREVLAEATSENSGVSENKKVQDANLIIESIRCEEFGLNPNLSYTESCLLKKQHARLGRALHCLSQELYSQDSHLLLELVQNADDNIYPEHVDPTIVFILQDTGIVILNNERGFSAQNIRALCDIGKSTKKGSGAGYIGHKGIGFKSVFRVTDAPEIHSNGFHVMFDITEGQIGFVLPNVIAPCDIDMFRRLLSGEEYQTDSNSWNTCILLPFRAKIREGTGINSLVSMFSDLHPSLLLFLHRLRCIKFKNMLNDELLVMRRETLADGIVRVSHGKETMNWLVISKKLEAQFIRHDVQTTEIAMAFTLQESENGEYKPHLSQQPVFAFLPLRNYGLKFILQGDFVLPSSREEVDGDSAWNQWLLSEFPALFFCAKQSFCSLPCFQKSPGKAVTAYMSFIPLVGEVHGFFSHLPHMIISKLRMSNCLLLDGPELKWVLPCRVLRRWNEQARMLLSDNLLHKHLGLGYMNRDIVLSDALSKALGVQDYGTKVLTEIISSICRTSDEIKLLGLEWLSSWLMTLYSTLSDQSSGFSSVNAGLECDVINHLRNIPFIPLSDGSYSSVSDGPIWLPCDIISVGFEGKHSPKDFPNLYVKLRMVNPLLFSAASRSTYNTEETRVDNLIQMLHKIGVQQLSAHEVIKSHVLVALSDDKQVRKDRNMMIEYLSYVMLHLQYSCASCQSEKTSIILELRKKPVCLTNHGFKCPDDEPIHFGKEYGNSVDIHKLIDTIDIKWIELDAAYLKHPSMQSLLFVTKWREFFEELGVTDFVQVTRVGKHVPEYPCTTSGGMICDEDLLVAAPFINDWESSELVNMLSIFSSKKCRENCIYLLEVLDKLWDDCYSVKARNYISSRSTEYKRPIKFSLIKSIQKIKWVASSMDQELHYSKDLFYNCEEVRSILGSMAPYAVPQVTSKLLLEEIGFKTQVSFNDAITLLHSWRMSKAPFMASTIEMSKFYAFISDGVAASKLKMNDELLSSSFIFIPYVSTSMNNDVVSGTFFSPKDVYWHDPAGCFDKTKEAFLQRILMKTTSCLPCKALSTIYPSLHDFFVNVCGVCEIPPFRSYFQILLQLSAVALPSQAAYSVFRVFLRWADELKSGVVKDDEIYDLKENLCKLENTVLPTLQDKWVSLHPSFGLICWSDDEKMKQHFKHSDGVDFLQFGELSNEEKDLLSGRVAILMKSIGIPSLSEVVSREAIFYGTEDNREKVSLINWVLPYAQRYIYKLHPDIYRNLKQVEFEKLSLLQVAVVDKLFYKYTLKGRDSTSKKRFECSCLLQGNVLYATQTSDSHTIFLELSRFFFSGSTELHLANFLHMVTTMADSGSTIEQIEFFIVNSQRIPKLPDEELVWSLSSLMELHQDEISQPICAPLTNVEQSFPTSKRKPGIISNWPPTDWKNAPDFSYHRRQLQTRPGLPPYDSSQIESRKPPENVMHKEDVAVPVEIDGDWIIEEGLASTSTMVLQDSVQTTDQPHSVELFDSFDKQISFSSEPKSKVSDSAIVPVADTDLSNLSTSLDKDRLFLQSPDENQSRKTGRLGELIAYKYFIEKLGSGSVKWVNEENETGLPYDLITGENEENREYVEVKATKSASKDWFSISMREWQFAVDQGDSFSIAHVVLLGPKKASITLLRNPFKLCQQNALRLAVLMSKKLRDSSVAT